MTTKHDNLSQTYISETPYITQMYYNTSQRINCLPSADPKRRGQLVDWGTRMYELEYQLHRKDQEIDQLNKKVIKANQTIVAKNKELARKQNITAKPNSRIKSWREKCLKLEQRLTLKIEENKWEKEKSKSMTLEINRLKNALKVYKSKRTTNKHCQTNRASTKSVQTQPQKSTLPEKRNISTQYMTPMVTVKVNQPLITDRGTIYDKKLLYQEPSEVLESTDAFGNSMKFNPVKNAEIERENSTNLEKEPIEYATAVNIKGARKNSRDDPLEMSFIQKFGDGKVQTLVKSNERFQITEKAISTPTADQISRAIEAIELNKEKPKLSANLSPYTLDSGVSSGFNVSRPHSAQNQNELAIPAGGSSRKILFPQRPQQQVRISPFLGYGKQAFKSSLPRTMMTPNPPVSKSQSTVAIARRPNCSSIKQQNSTLVPPSFQSNESRPVSAHFSKEKPQTLNLADDDDVRGFPFLRRIMDAESYGKKKIPGGDKPVFIHTSDIQLF